MGRAHLEACLVYSCFVHFISLQAFSGFSLATMDFRHFSSPRARSLAEPLLGIADAVARKQPEESLVYKLWNNAETDRLKANALSTTFIKGVDEGDLYPNFYGKYTVQDAVYCRLLANLWQRLASDPRSDEYLRTLFTKLHKSYDSYSAQMFKWWHIQADGDQYGVWLGQPAADYVQMIEDSTKDKPAYVLLASYPCLKLWPYLGSVLASQQKPDSQNVYGFWIEENKDEDGSVKRHEEAIDFYAKDLDEKKAFELFFKGMQSEINFFSFA